MVSAGALLARGSSAFLALRLKASSLDMSWLLETLARLAGALEPLQQDKGVKGKRFSGMR